MQRKRIKAAIQATRKRKERLGTLVVPRVRTIRFRRNAFGPKPEGRFWEVRSTLPSNRIARLILCFHQGTLVVLHGFIKKTRKTPAEDIALAKRRMKEMIR